MVSNAWHEVWIKAETVEMLRGECIWNVYAAVSRPHQVAMDIISAIAEIGAWASYEDIAKFVGYSPMTVSQCVNDLSKAGYPFVWNNVKQLRIERGTTTGRPPKAIAVETKGNIS